MHFDFEVEKDEPRQFKANRIKLSYNDKGFVLTDTQGYIIIDANKIQETGRFRVQSLNGESNRNSLKCKGEKRKFDGHFDFILTLQEDSD